MSRIKILFAEVNGDDDLTVNEKEKEELMKGELRTLNQIKKAIANHIDNDSVKATLKHYFSRSYEIGDDDGHMTITNFPNMCSELATFIMDTMVDIYRLDLPDNAYTQLEAWTTNLLMVQYDDYMLEIIKDLEEA